MQEHKCVVGLRSAYQISGGLEPPKVSSFIATTLHTSSYVGDSPEGMGLYGAAVHKCKILGVIGVNMLRLAILIMCSGFNSVDASSKDVDGSNADIHTHKLSAFFLNPGGLSMSRY